MQFQPELLFLEIKQRARGELRHCARQPAVGLGLDDIIRYQLAEQWWERIADLNTLVFTSAFEFSFISDSLDASRRVVGPVFWRIAPMIAAGIAITSATAIESTISSIVTGRRFSTSVSTG
jgi:hypothetical protein